MPKLTKTGSRLLCHVASVRFKDLAGYEHVVPLETVATYDLSATLPIRKFPRWPGQVTTPGYYWAATHRRSLAFESYLERQWLTILDFDPDVTSFSAQPMEVNPGRIGGWSHTPDICARRTDGSFLVCEVKGPLDVNSDDTRLTTERMLGVCATTGWSYQVVTTPPPQLWTNIRWFARYRRPFIRDDEIADRVLAAAGDGMRFGELVAIVGDPFRVLPTLFHLCWTGELSLDLHHPLRNSTIVSRGVSSHA